MGLRDPLLDRLYGKKRPAFRAPADRPRTRSAPSLADYPHLHPSLLRFSPEDDLEPSFLAAIREDRVADLVVGLHPDLYVLSPVAASWRQRLLEEVLHVSAWATEVGCRYDPPNSMNRDGVILDEIGLGPALEALVQAVVQPLARHLFPEVGGDALDGHHGFVVEYRPGGDVDLGFHVDDSEVTLNLCLGTSFSGGDLYFEGRRCAQHRQTDGSPRDRVVYAHQPGVALLHAGKHRHGALPLTGGERLNLILWCRSSAYRAMVDEREVLGGGEGCPVWCQRSRAR